MSATARHTSLGDPHILRDLGHGFAAVPTSRFVYAQHFQPEGMLIGLVPFQVGAFHLSLLPIPLGEIDQARALRAEHVHTQA